MPPAEEQSTCGNLLQILLPIKLDTREWIRCALLPQALLGLGEQVQQLLLFQSPPDVLPRSPTGSSRVP